jgi:hypothetical protein
LKKKIAMNSRLLLIFCFVGFLESQEDFQLPNATEPESYTVIITTNVPQASTRFTGELSLYVKVVEATKEIYLHSRGHTILEHNLYDLQNPSTPVELPGITLTRFSSDVIVVTSVELLQPNRVYDLHIKYQGNLLLASDGFFRSDYVVNEGGSDTYT